MIESNLNNAMNPEASEVSSQCPVISDIAQCLLMWQEESSLLGCAVFHETFPFSQQQHWHCINTLNAWYTQHITHADNTWLHTDNTVNHSCCEHLLSNNSFKIGNNTLKFNLIVESIHTEANHNCQNRIFCTIQYSLFIISLNCDIWVGIFTILRNPT